MHIFYKAAFEVLFQRHDATKPEFKRQYKNQAFRGEDNFERIFSTFCFMTYVDKHFSFNERTIMEYARKAIEYEASETKSRSFVEDLVDNVT